jgi:hypothetical protein
MKNCKTNLLFLRFNGSSGYDSTEWLREKSLVTFEIATSLVDLANESDTTPW